MEYLDTLKYGLVNNAEGVYATLASIVPKLLVAFIIVVIAYFIAISLQKVVKKIAKKLKINSLVEQTSIDEHLESAGVKMDLADFLGSFVKWVVLIIALLIVVDIFNLETVENFINQLLGVVGRIIVALLVFAITVYVARFTNAIAIAIAKYIKVKNTSMIAHIASAVIYLVGVLVILDVLQIEVIKGLVVSIIEAFAYGATIAFGLAFGLGGQDKAKEWIEKMKK